MTTTAASVKDMMNAITRTLVPDSTEGAIWRGSAGVSYCLASGGSVGLLLIAPVEGLGAAIPVAGPDIDALRREADGMEALFALTENPDALDLEAVRATPLGLARAIGVIDRAMANALQAGSAIHPAFAEKIMSARNAGYAGLVRAIGAERAFALIYPPSLSVH